MNLSINEIDLIVREVMARLSRTPEEDAPACSTPTAASETTPVRDDQTLVITDRVVSMADLNGSLGRVRRVVVPPGAVVTPAVRDLLQDRSIALQYDTPGASALLGGCSKLTVVAALTSFNPASLVEALCGDGLAAVAETSKCLIETTDRLAESLLKKPDALAVILTPHVAAAVCLANRLPSLRAVSASDAESAVDAARSVGANVLVVCPKRKTPFQLQRIVGRFAASGPYDCPESLRDRLGSVKNNFPN
ncbi:MAG: hypothetical protein JW818_07895 [Pirellulales bacterium]|nr:hypothetical protein [Pirellulales bacterium]